MTMIRAQDGTQLLLHSYPQEGARATVAVLHGYGEHGGRYQHVMEAWQAHGIQSFAIDVRGHGRSEGRRGYVGRFPEYHQDLRALLEVVESKRNDKPFFVFGHSHGALIALHGMLTAGIGKGAKGLLLSSPFLGVALPVNPIKRGLGVLMSGIWPTLALPAGIKGTDVTRDPEQARLYEADPLNNKNATARWFTEAMGAIAEVQTRAGELSLPTILLYGGADKTASANETDRLAASLKMSDRVVERIAGGPHELVNDLPDAKAQVIERYGKWMAERAG
ncbi:MAG: alpha/beta hydrolase [Myxococcota bacterium]